MIARHTLPNGVRIVAEHVPAVRSVATGVWVDVGSRDEGEGVHGASHFLEHLLFKGTADWSAAEIARCLDAIGGEFNAYTSKEQTVFVVRTLDDDVSLGLDILSDITQRPAFRSDELESERSVVLEEINMHEDAPDEVAFDFFGAALLAGHPLERTILGSRDELARISREAIATYHADKYTAGRLVIAAAGNIEPDAFVREVRKRWGSMAATPMPVPRAETHLLAQQPRLHVVERDSEQVHMLVGVRTMAQDNPRRHALTILNHVFGGGMSSRLFQDIREDRGLVYSVYSFRVLFTDVGELGVYAAAAPSHTEETLSVVSEQFDSLRDGVSPEEFEAARTHIKGALALSQEDTSSRMSRIGRAELTLGEAPSMDELVARVEGVTLDEVNELATELADAPRTVTALGPLDESTIERVTS